MEYLEMCYRREFKITPQELDEMPVVVFLRDLEFMSLEAKAERWKNP
jgi:hypothetical protein